MTRPVALKAYIAILTALGTWGATAFAPDNDGVSRVTAVEWFAILGVAVAGLAVYAAKNGESVSLSTSTPQPTSVDWEAAKRMGDRGAVPVVELLLIVLVVVVLLVLLGVL